jgi:hypothetical protein
VIKHAVSGSTLDVVHVLCQFFDASWHFARDGEKQKCSKRSMLCVNDAGEKNEQWKRKQWQERKKSSFAKMKLLLGWGTRIRT